MLKSLRISDWRCRIPPRCKFFAGEGSEEEDGRHAIQADSDCIEILPPSVAPRSTGVIESHAAAIGHGPQHSSIEEEEQQQEQQNMGPRSKIWTGTTDDRGGDDSSAPATPGFGVVRDAVAAQPATLMQQLSKGRRGSTGASQVEVQLLLAMGFTEVQARKALQNCSHDVQRAANWLLAGT